MVPETAGEEPEGLYLCGACSGSGQGHGADWLNCSACSGLGEVAVVDPADAAERELDALDRRADREMDR